MEVCSGSGQSVPSHEAEVGERNVKSKGQT